MNQSEPNLDEPSCEPKIRRLKFSVVENSDITLVSIPRDKFRYNDNISK